MVILFDPYICSLKLKSFKLNKVHNVHNVYYTVVKCSVRFDNPKICQVTNTAACPIIKRNNTKISAQKRKRRSKDTKTKQKASKKPKVTKYVTAGYADRHRIITKIPIYDVNRSSH